MKQIFFPGLKNTEVPNGHLFFAAGMTRMGIVMNHFSALILILL